MLFSREQKENGGKDDTWKVGVERKKHGKWEGKKTSCRERMMGVWRKEEKQFGKMKKKRHEE